VWLHLSRESLNHAGKVSRKQGSVLGCGPSQNGGCAAGEVGQGDRDGVSGRTIQETPGSKISAAAHRKIAATKRRWWPIGRPSISWRGFILITATGQAAVVREGLAARLSD
jgi:hypothetical protein